MARYSKRSVNSMFNGAIAATEDATIAQLREEIENLKSLSNSSLELPVEDIVPLQLPGKLKQPRLYFDPQKMERLKESIDKHGVLEPILVRPGARDRLEIISGERRWRCCRELGKTVIPAIVRHMTDEIALEAALVAHLLNEGITAIEQTESILSLLSLRLNLSVDDVKTGLYQIKNSVDRASENSRILTDEQLDVIQEVLSEFGMKLSSFVSNRLPMLNLAPNILEAVREGRLSPTTAVILNRQPADLHDELILLSEGLTKQGVIKLVKENLNFHSPDKSCTIELTASDRVFSRLKAVKKNRKLLGSPKVQKYFSQIEQLIEKIESLDR